jgi:hypothetical protein
MRESEVPEYESLSPEEAEERIKDLSILLRETGAENT